LIRELLLQPAKQLFIFLIAATENGHQERKARQIVGDLRNQVKPFLRSESGDDAYHWKFEVGICKAELLKKVALAIFFAFEVADGKLPENVCIPLRVPLTIVNTIENAGDRGGTLAQHAFKTKPVFRCLDFV